MNKTDKGRILAEALPYLRAFHGKTIVVRFGGKAMADPALKRGFARDVALLRLVGMKVVVVHGGGWGIDELMRKMGHESKRYRGHRITDEKTLTLVEMALSELNQELTSLINLEGGRAVGHHGQDGGVIRAPPLEAPAGDPHPPPCTTTTFMPTRRSSATSRANPCLSAGSAIACPPKRTTIVLPWKARRYGSASARMRPLSDAFIGMRTGCGPPQL
jgi:hypothetical protein